LLGPAVYGSSGGGGRAASSSIRASGRRADEHRLGMDVPLVRPQKSRYGLVSILRALRDAAMSSALSRMQRAALQRREAAKCPPHPPDRMYWQQGDAMTPDKRVCGRCYAVLGSRRHFGPRHELIQEADAEARHLAGHGERVKRHRPERER
jgi:hypothetical protein